MRRVLVFSRTTGYRHDSIPAGVRALRDLWPDVVATEDPDVFTGAKLADVAAVVFLNTNGTVLTDAGRTALEAYVRGGGGFLGVHSAAATEYDWPFYGELVGAGFDRHPQVQPATVTVTDPDHPATAHLPARWPWVDEWYDFRSYPRARILLRVDESTYDGGRTGVDHPLAWCHDRLGGRAFYTALGHTVEAYADGTFRAHLAGALRWVTGVPRPDGST
ncbi:ThuA domain-containing protein [Micromonospora craniellae]|uniref:ThuA domain-containing protein n=1 Tax=Micromonospora craniellae TaxID=2294034 RepID=A0A372FXK4_9ACTN|nr:ThuA domain-containing protein [Micromonospora craniellae]QOC91569.1 ThuA domain-containing protein [Micromonospora craniellae]RFS45522.1 ThuA domain-containing protein [Micromonospora craniellae]